MLWVLRADFVTFFCWNFRPPPPKKNGISRACHFFSCFTFWNWNSMFDFCHQKLFFYVLCLNWKYTWFSLPAPNQKKRLIPLRLALWEWGSPTGITLAKERGQALIWNNPQICSLKHFRISIVWAHCVQKVHSDHDSYNRFASLGRLGPRHLNFFFLNKCFPQQMSH